MSRILAAALLVALCGPRWAAGAEMWVTGYYVGWRQRHMTPRDIDFKAITHLIHFGAHPRPDGTLNAGGNLLNGENIAAAVKAAHDAGKKILVTVGGQSSRPGFVGAMSAANRRAFIDNVVRFVEENGYDGVDIDMEEITPEDARDYSSFIRELRARLDLMRPRPLLTAAVLWEPRLFATLADQFDQINIMTYNLSGPYPGWVTWHNGSVYDGGYRFPNATAPLPSIDGLVHSFIAAGVPKSKLGIGLCFNGYVWSGGEVSRPRQAWISPPAVKDMPYFALADAYHITEYDYGNPAYRWDRKAQAAYLSIDGPGGAESQFVSYDNEVSVRKKVQYARETGIGGVFIWELAGGWRDSQPPGRRDVLLQAVKHSALLR